jgi:steroid 5-alpha reductase family enzyme
MGLIGLILIAGAFILGIFILLWLISLLLKNSSIVDVFWGFGFVLVAWVTFLFSPWGFPLRKILSLSLVTIWGLRLSMHILKRNWRKPEDFRYQKWRADHGAHWWWRSFFQVFILQAFLMWVISIPLVFVQWSKNVPYCTLWDALAIVVWGIGFFFEFAGDTQLARFRTNSENKRNVLDTGVWRYTRHPNYFGDSTQWWGYFLFALACGGWWTIFSPILMTLFLLRVSGVVLLEKNLLVTKPQYKEYIDRTSAFIPWFPKKNKNQGAD